ncbi:acetyl-CoA decarbonylase/synthase complex subunit gamma [Thermodesulfobacteriota bacterium]
MALTGIQIFKLLPKTNCKECAEPTCLAFAMKLAAGKAELASCPYVSDEAKAQLSEASAPPIRGVVLGTGDNQIKVGEELVLYRHEKTFVNPTAIAVLIEDSMSDDEVTAKIDQLNNTSFERVGYILKANLAAVRCKSGDAAKFKALVEKVSSATTNGIVLISDSPDCIKEAVSVCADKKPLIYSATKDTVDAFSEIAKAHNVAIAVKGTIDEIVEMTEKLIAAGHKDIVIDADEGTYKGTMKNQTIVRRSALKKKFRPLGFPTISFACDMTDDDLYETTLAAGLISKYAGIVVVSNIDAPSLLALTVNRLNIFTDPQRPMVMEQGIYEFNNPTADSPILITTNFALTYFIVSAEIEASRVPTWLLIMDTEGMSVLTAWSAGKFVADAMAPFVIKSGIAEKISHKDIIIPGYVAQLSGEFQEELDGWDVKVGPREAGDLPKYLRNIAG